MPFPSKEEPDFIEKRKAWRSKLDKPIGLSMKLTLIPTLILCTFLVLAAPYLKIIAFKFLDMEKQQVILSIEMAEDTEPVAPPEPPPNPDIAIAKIYQDLYDKQGFDWRTKPEIEFPVLEQPPEIQKEIKPVEVELILNLPKPKAEGAVQE